jgi:hypothetical protein
MNSPAIASMNDSAVGVIEHWVNTSSPAIPYVGNARQACLDAINAYRSGSRDPELMLFISSMFCMGTSNLMRQRLSEMFAVLGSQMMNQI